MLRAVSTARDPKGKARVTRHHLPQVGAVGRSGTGKTGLRTSSRAAATTRVAHSPVRPSPTRPIHSAMARARPSQPAQPSSAPAQTNNPVAIICHTMVW